MFILNVCPLLQFRRCRKYLWDHGPLPQAVPPELLHLVWIYVRCYPVHFQQSQLLA